MQRKLSFFQHRKLDIYDIDPVRSANPFSKNVCCMKDMNFTKVGQKGSWLQAGH